MLGKCLLIFSVLFVCSNGDEDPRFDFPDTLEPTEYLLKLKTDFKNEKRFRGEVIIKVTCKKPTFEIILNSKDLEIIEDSIKVELVSEEQEKDIDISEPYKIADAEQYVIPVKTSLVAGSQYEIHISFRKNLSHDFNVYQFHSVIDSQYNSKEYYGFTRIGPGQARFLFPSIDQMKYKAKFEIIHDHPDGVTGFSNMPLEHSGPSTHGEHWKSDIFKKSMPMSTHTVGFALAQLSERKDKDPASGATISIWSDTLTYPLTDDFRKMIIRIFNFYTDFFKVNYPFQKLDILILPQYKNGYDKDTLGLIVFGDSKTLHSVPLDVNEETEMAKEMCQAIGRQWIGIYTTMTQWNQHWLHRALVHLFSSPCTEKAFPETVWKYSESLALTAFTDVLENDVDESGDPVYNPSDNVDYSYSDPESIVSEKAYLLVRMLRLALGEDVFQKSMEKYLKLYGEKNSNLDQFWQIFNDAASAAKKLPFDSRVTVKQFMDSWSTKTRYPLFKVKRDYHTNMVSITQEPFVWYEEERKDEEAESSKDCWISPIAYKTEGGSVDDGEKHWFTCSKDELKINLKDLPIDKWVVFNLRAIAPLRILYDYDNWKLLSKALLNGEKFKEIDDMTRATLLFDMFEFARAGKLEKLGYPFVMNTLKYLITEDSYFVWLVAANELEKLYHNFFRTKIFYSYQKYIKAILTKVFEKSEERNLKELTIIDPHLKHKYSIFNISCRFGVSECEEQCLELYRMWSENLQSTEEQPIPVDIRDTVLCHAVKHDEKNWHDLLEKYDRSDKYKINSNIFFAAGCSTKRETLEEYLEMILSPNQNIAPSDREDIFNSLAWNEKGYPLAKEFLINKHKAIENRFPGKTAFVDSYLEKLLNATTTEKDLNDITNLMQVIRPKENEENETLWEENVAKVKRNILWYEKNEKLLLDFFENVDLSEFLQSA